MTILHTPTNNLENSLNFYKKLAFKTIKNDGMNVVTDGKAIIEINPDRFARAGVKLFRKTWTTVIEQLKKMTAVVDLKNGFLLSDPSGTWIYLIEEELDLKIEKVEDSFGVTGNFAGLSLETTDMAKSASIWQILGFKKTMGDLTQGWVAYQNEDELVVSLMKPLSCPHLFFNPSFTYFNGKKNLEIIEKIRKLDIPITEEITHFNKEGVVDNIIIRDPGGYGFFLFSD